MAFSVCSRCSAWLAAAVLVFFAVCALLCGCDPQRKESRRSDTADHRPFAQPLRIVSLAPSMTESLFALNLGSRVVGVSRYCDFPAEAKRLPKVGGFVDPSLESILALKPTLVVGARSPTNRGVVRKLKQQGIATWFPPVTAIADVRSVLLELGRRTGRKHLAQQRVAEMQLRLSAIEKQYSEHSKPRVLLIYGEEPLAVAGPGSLGDDMIGHAQGRNAVQQGSRYPTISLERALELAPDVIVAARHGRASTESTIDWQRYPHIPAVQDGRVHVLTDDRLLRPGPRLVDGIELLASTIHARDDNTVE